MSGSVPGYPTPALDPSEVRPDPDEDNPNELVLDPTEVEEPLPPLDTTSPHETADQEDDGGPATD